MNVLGLCAYPKESAATRFRLEQFVKPLTEHGIELSVSPFLESETFTELYKSGNLFTKGIKLVLPVFRRLIQARSISGYDLLFVQREAMFFGPAFFEWLYANVGRLPMVLDLDDATYIRYESPNFGSLAKYLKFFGKTDRLIERSRTVVCGNRFIAEYVENKGTKAAVIPTITDPSAFRSDRTSNEIPVVGWIGTNSAFPFLKKIFPVLTKIAEKHKFVFKVIGAGSDQMGPQNVDARFVDWALNREKEDLETMDIGLYPLFNIESADENWIEGKSGFKAIQYMSAGIPFIMSPKGVCAEIGRDRETHFNAKTMDDWYNHLDKLLTDAEVRRRMGLAGRQFAIENYGLEQHAKRLAEVFYSAVRSNA